MMKPQYRTTTRNMQVREKPNEEAFEIEGYFIVYDDETELWDGVYEKIDRNALDGQLDKDIRALYDHDTSKVLGRVKNNTLRLESDDKGLKGIVTINRDDPEALSIYQKIKRGDVDQCSFGFIPTKQDRSTRPGGGELFTVRELDLIEVSVVAFPAYENTSIAARKKDYERDEIKKFKQRMRGKLDGFKDTNA